MTILEVADGGAAGVRASPLIDVDEVAAMLGISARSVWRYRDSGKLPMPISLGGLKRWNADEIRRWIEAGCPSRKEWDARKKLK